MPAAPPAPSVSDDPATPVLPDAPAMPRPSFFIVGHSKSGTTALAQFLGQHPALFMSDAATAYAALALGH